MIRRSAALVVVSFAAFLCLPAWGESVPGLSLTVRAGSTQMGHPVAVTVTLANTGEAAQKVSPLRPSTQEMQHVTVDFMIRSDSEKEFRQIHAVAPYLGPLWGGELGTLKQAEMAPGKSLETTVALLLDWVKMDHWRPQIAGKEQPFPFLFPEPGIYHLKAVYYPNVTEGRRARSRSIVSEELRIEVVAAEGAEKNAWLALTKIPHWWCVHAPDELVGNFQLKPDDLQGFLQDHGESSHADYARFALAKFVAPDLTVTATTAPSRDARTAARTILVPVLKKNGFVYARQAAALDSLLEKPPQRFGQKIGVDEAEDLVPVAEKQAQAVRTLVKAFFDACNAIDVEGAVKLLPDDATYNGLSKDRIRKELLEDVAKLKRARDKGEKLDAIAEVISVGMNKAGVLFAEVQIETRTADEIHGEPSEIWQLKQVGDAVQVVTMNRKPTVGNAGATTRKIKP